MRPSFEKLTWLGVAAVFAILAVSHGTPAFRHDWMWPTNHQQFWQILRDSLSGWSPDGIGDTSPRMLGFVVNPFIVAAGLAFGPIVALFLWTFLIASVIGHGARRIGVVLGRDDMYTKFAATVFATYNPWTYDHLIAGHTHMLLAFGATLALTSHALQKSAPPDDHSDVEAALWIALAMVQLQFLVLDLVPIIAIVVRRRTLLPLMSFVVAALPTAIGILFDVRQLANTPYTAAWEQVQSIPFRDGWHLTGYFGAYDRALPTWSSIILQITIAAVIAGALISRRRLGSMSIVFASAILLVVSGSSDPIGAAALDTMNRVPALRIFRELNDLIGFVVVAYTIALIVAAENSIVRKAIAAACLLLMPAWLAAPPGNFWVDGRSVAPLNASIVAPQSRFALFPAFQPLSHLGRGSGVDVQTFALPNNRSPLNAYLPEYPTSVALSLYQRNRDTRLLQALSVSTVFERDSLVSVASIFAPRNGAHYPNSERVLQTFTPMLSVCDTPAVGTLDTNVGACNEFAGDIRRNDLDVRPISSPQETTNAATSWIDARLVFPNRPELGQAFGGAYTTSAAPLAVTGHAAILAEIVGRLSTDTGKTVVGNGSYRWIKLPGNAHSLTCHGECLVAASAARLPDRRFPLNPPGRPSKQLSFTQIAPWLSFAGVPSRGILRYNVRFNRGWMAADRCGILTHVRLDAVVNGWQLRQCDSGDLVIGFAPAIAQFALAVAALLWFGWLAYRFTATNESFQAILLRERQLLARG